MIDDIFDQKYFYHRNGTAETGCCDNASKNVGQHSELYADRPLHKLRLILDLRSKDSLL